MAQDRRFPSDAISVERIGPGFDVCQYIHNIIEMRLCVNTARNGQAAELEGGFQLFSGDGIIPRHEGTDVTGADTPFQIQFQCQCLCREQVIGNVRLQGLRVKEHRMSADRRLKRDTLFLIKNNNCFTCGVTDTLYYLSL